MPKIQKRMVDLTKNDDDLNKLFSKENKDESIVDAMARANRAIQKVLPARIAFAEKVMMMSDEDCLKAINAFLAGPQPRQGGVVL